MPLQGGYATSEVLCHSRGAILLQGGYATSGALCHFRGAMILAVQV